MESQPKQPLPSQHADISPGLPCTGGGEADGGPVPEPVECALRWRPLCAAVQVTAVGTGVMGYLGNKGWPCTAPAQESGLVPLPNFAGFPRTRQRMPLN